jgi:LmbE family N-acetylglucosaminyl deacetylase
LVRIFTWLGRLMGQDPTQFGRNKDIDLTRVGKPADQIHVRVDIRDFLKAKQEASACHSSQGGHGGRRRQAGFSLRQWLISRANATLARSESYQQLYPPPSGRRQSFFE